MSRRYPRVDNRRAAELLTELLKSAATMVPEWRGASDPGDIGHALLAIAAHFGEQVTERLDRTPERDWVEFLRFLDAPRQPVEVATVPLVFTVAEGRDSPVYVPARTQAAAAVEGGERIFETREAVSLTPARLSSLFAVDPAADNIEAPPPGFLEPPRPRSATPDYTLASFAARDSDTVQITPAVGLRAGAVIRIEGHQPVYRIQKDRGEGVFRLLDRLDGPAAQGARVTMVTTFELFHLRNLQDHAVYLGHESLFNVQQPADITLTITPANAVARLAALDVTYALWGTNEDELAEDPDWIPLKPVYGNGIVRLQKTWRGSVDPRPLPRSEDKSRWLRIRLGAAIAPLATIGTLTERIGLEVRSAFPSQPGNVEGSQTITRALHNLTPIALSTRFFPFGVEPLRFDSFALAAPEALSKRGARVALEFDLASAAPANITMPYSPYGRLRAYLVTEQGALHVLTLNKSSGLIERWQALGYPTRSVASGVVRLSADFPPLAGPKALKDVVVVRDRDGTFWSAEVERMRTGSAVVLGWLALPPLPPDCNLASAILLPKETVLNSTVYGSVLVALTDNGLYTIELDHIGSTPRNWEEVLNTSEEVGNIKPNLLFNLDPSVSRPQIVQILQSDFPALPITQYKVVILAADGILWRGTLTVNDNGLWSVSWKKISKDKDKFSLNVRLAASGEVVFAAKHDTRELVKLAQGSDPEESSFRCNDRTSILCVPSFESDILAIAFGSSGGSLPQQLAFWKSKDSTPNIVPSPTPSGAAQIVISLDQNKPPILVQKATGETIFSTLLARGGLGQQSASARSPRTFQNPMLSWEYFDGQGWRRLEHDFTDTTANFEGDGTVSFIVPDDLSPTEIAGQTDYWIRARLVGGDYGRPQYIVKAEGTAPNLTQTITVDTSQLNPPEILSIEASYNPAPAQIENPLMPERVIVDNNGTQRDQTQANAVAGATFQLFEGAAAIDPAAADRRALYLGFNPRQLDSGTLSIFVNAQENEQRVDLTAEVLVGGTWLSAGLQDETGGLQRRGFLRISIRQRPSLAALFGGERYWLRLRPRADVRDWQPSLSAVFINAILAEHAESVSRELLGSSDGSPNQVFQLSQRPIVCSREPAPADNPDPELELRVRETLGLDEQRTLDVARYPNDPNMPGDWVRWRWVESFVDHDAAARVFLLDPISGEVRFGNDRSGRVPPAGRDNIRVISYRSGGGAQGNVAAFRIENLKTAIESVDEVINPLDAAGGVAAPTQEEELARAPARLQHRDQAITPRDIEALALSFSPDVVRARCLPPSRPGTPITLTVAMRNGGRRCPPLSLERRDALIAYLRSRDGGVFDAVDLEVKAPDYHRLRLDVELRVTDLAMAARVERESHQRLFTFLDPLAGGPDGRGWPFGRPLRRSDVLRVLGDIEGIDQVTSLVIEEQSRGADLTPTSVICAAASDDVRVVVSGVGGVN